jgi:hypothetical protein
MKDIKIEERPEGFVYIEDTTFPAEPHGSYLKRNIQKCIRNNVTINICFCNMLNFNH